MRGLGTREPMALVAVSPRCRRRLLGAVVVALIAVHALFIAAPIRYAGTFMTVGEGILSGRLPYVHFVDHKPPGVYYVFALGLAAVDSAYTVKALVFGSTLLTGGLTYQLGARLSSREGGLVAVALYLAGSAVYEGVYFHQESLVAPFALLGTLALFRAESTGSRRQVALAGLAFGVSALFKQPGFLLMATAGGYLLWRGRDGNEQATIVDATVLSVAGALPITLWAGYFLAVGGFSEFFYWVFVVNLPGGAYGRQPLRLLVGGAVSNLSRFPLVWALGLAGVARAVRPESDTRLRFLLLALAAAVFPVSVRNFEHYWLLPLPFAALLAVRPVVELFDQLDVDAVHPNTRSLMIGALVFLSLPLGWHVAFTGLNAYGVGAPGGVATVETQERIGGRIAEETAPDDRIVTLGEQHEYYFFADRRPASRHLYYLPVNRDRYSQAGIVRLLGRPNVTYVVVGAPCQPELARVCRHLRSDESGYELVGRYHDSQDDILLYRKVPNQTAGFTRSDRLGAPSSSRDSQKALDLERRTTRFSS